MARKQLGMVDEALLSRVDARARELGQTRRVFTERALEAALPDDTQAAMPGPVAMEAGGAGRPLARGDNASATGAAAARGASRPAASPRAPVVGAGLSRFEEAQARMARTKTTTKGGK